MVLIVSVADVQIDALVLTEADWTKTVL